MLPIDSGTIAVSVYRGFAWRDSADRSLHLRVAAQPDDERHSRRRGGLQRYARGAAPVRRRSGPCRSTAAPGSLLDLSTAAPSGAPPARRSSSGSGSRIRSARRASTRTAWGCGATWRAGDNEELMAPFDTSSRFRFYVSGADVVDDRATADLGHSRTGSGAGRAEPARDVERFDAGLVSTVVDVGVLQERSRILNTEQLMKFSLALSNRKGFALPMALLVITALTAALAAGFASVAAGIHDECRRARTEPGVQSRADGAGAVHGPSQPRAAGAELRRRSRGRRLGMDAHFASRRLRRRRCRQGAADRSARRMHCTSSDRAASTRRSSSTPRAPRRRRTDRGRLRDVEYLDDEGRRRVAQSVRLEQERYGCDQRHRSVRAATARRRRHGRQGRPATFRATASTRRARRRWIRPTRSTSSRLKTGIDWAGIMAGQHPCRTSTIPGESFPSASDFDNDPNYWPVIRVHTNGFSLPNRGRGIIIADSNFTISGSNMWDGIVLVGGQLTSNGNNTTAGATLSGLNF